MSVSVRFPVVRRIVLKRFFTIVLALQFGFSPLLMSAAQARQASDLRQTENGFRLLMIGQMAETTHTLVREAPFMRELLEAPAPTPIDLDQWVDEDPFFATSQRWIPAADLARSIDDLERDYFRQQDERTQVLVGTALLDLPGELRPAGADEEFFYFQRPSPPWDGLYFINKAEALLRQQYDAFVPVYFLPLPELAAPISATHRVSELDQLFIEVGGETLPIDTAELRAMAAWQSRILIMGQSLCWQSNDCLPKGIQTFDPNGILKLFSKTIPLPGSIAARGFALRRPSTGTDRAFSLPPAVSEFFIKSAHASSPSSGGIDLFGVYIDPDIFVRLEWVGTVLAATFVASVVAKHTLLWEKVRRIRLLKELERIEKEYPTLRGEVAVIKALWARISMNGSVEDRTRAFLEIDKGIDDLLARGQGRDLSWIEKRLRHLKISVKDSFDVFAHSITAIGQFSGVTGYNTVRYAADRWMPELAASKNSYVHKFIENTFGTSKKMATKNAVDGKIMFLGVVVLGGYDTIAVGLQGLYIVPAMANYLAQPLPAEAQAFVYKAFDMGNPDLAHAALRDLLRNGIAWVQNGTAHFAADSKAIEEPRALDVAQRELRAKGLDPEKAQNRQLLEDTKNRVLNELLVRQGLPSDEKFLFDLGEIYKFGYKFSGYEAGAQSLPLAAGGETGASILFNRPGLLRPTLKKALRLAKLAQEQSPSPSTAEVVQFFERLNAKVGRLDQFSATLKPLGDGDYWRELWVKNGAQQNSVSSSGSTPLNIIDQTLALQSWITAKTQAGLKPAFDAAAEARSLRAELSKLSYEGPVDYLYTSNPKIFEGLSEEAAEKSNRLFRYAVLSTVHSKDEFQLSNRLDARANPAVEANRPLPQRMPKGWFARWQIRQAEDTARKAVARQGVSSQDPAYEQTFFRAFRDRLARSNNVSFGHSPGDHVAKAEKRAWAAVEMAKREADIEALEATSPLEHIRTLAYIYSQNFLDAYRDETIGKEDLHPHALDQPGGLQKFRIFLAKKIGGTKAHYWANATARFFESYVDPAPNRLGLTAELDRRIPMFHDLRMGFWQGFKLMPVALTFGALWIWNFWGVNIPYSYLVLFATFAGLIWGPQFFLNRATKAIGWKPANDTWSKFLYANPYAWLTFFGLFPTYLLFGPASQVIPPFLNNFVLPVATTGAALWVYLKFLWWTWPTKDEFSTLSQTPPRPPSAAAPVVTVPRSPLSPLAASSIVLRCESMF